MNDVLEGTYRRPKIARVAALAVWTIWFARIYASRQIARSPTA